MYARVDNTDRCPRHGANKIAEAGEKIRIKQYMLAKYLYRAKDLSSEDVKSLAGEIGVLRLLLENKLNMCGDAASLAISAPAVSDLIMKISKLVTTSHKLEESLNKLLDEGQIMQLADAVTDVINKHVEDPKVRDLIATEIGMKLAQVATGVPKADA